jgi:hypothetical protein
MARRKDMGIAIAVGFDDGRRDPVAPESFSGSQSQPNIDWPGLIAANPDQPRFTSQVPSGTQHDEGQGSNEWSWSNRANGRRWSGGVDWNRHRRSNRTGE